tara:strand:+ start:14471 stop:14767 length:297 start_codon:yes stop_codon:yes gene_type:complete
MAKISKAKRGKNRWIGLLINQKPISRTILEDKLGKIMGDINWKLFDLIDTEIHTLAILRTSLEDSSEAKKKINSTDGISTLTTSGKIRLVRKRLDIHK